MVPVLVTTLQPSSQSGARHTAGTQPTAEEQAPACVQCGSELRAEAILSCSPHNKSM